MNIRKLFCPGNTPRILLFLFFFVVSVITTIACGYTEKNATGNVLLLFLLLLLAHRNTLTSITALLFLFCCALYAPAGMTYGKINNSFIVALLQTTTDEAAEFTGMIPVYHFLVSAAIQVFMVIFWRTHRRGHRNWLALLLFVLCSVNSWPLRMVKGTVVGTTDTLREMQRYKQLNQHGADNWKILPGVSNQGKLGEHDTRISVIASDAEHTVFLKKGSFASRKTDDMLLLQETERALADKSSPKVIFLHMMGSHPNPCDRLHSWPNHYLEQYPRKVACYLASISKLDNFLGQLDGILRRHSRHFAMLYFSDHGLSVSDSANPVHHDGHVQGGYSVPLIITASDITSHQSVSRKISARHFAGIFQWLTGIRTENIPPFNPLTDEDNEPVMVFNGERNVPADSLKPQPLILPDRR
ncbi:sulfatase-like hydrolase/transferase [Escherichia coli]|nr:sulfatase-like hydrolase/transferase [Escherichia coli]EKY6934291.1 sulfatase-like hydrolase/transferase [Escherichia coli]